MPFKWKKKSNRLSVSPDSMKNAVLEVIEGSKLRTTANKYNIDKMTLRRYVLKYREKGAVTEFVPNFSSSQIFSRCEEEMLAKYLLNAAQMNYGFTSKETRKFAYLYAVENNKKVPENWIKKESATYEWLRGFMNRNNTLSLRTPEPTSLSRGTAFNKHTVGEFFNLLGTILAREEFGPGSIYNCDETGVQTVHKPRKIISKKGQKQVAKVTSGERGQTVTILCTINAIGGSIPPFFIYPRVREQDYMTACAPPGSRAATHPSGWMTALNFEVYLQHFIKFTKCSIADKVLLILDNHNSHLSPKGLDICKENGIVLLTIPPHTSHRLQPLDVSVYGPFKTFYNQACDDFMIQNPGQIISLKNIAKLVEVAYQRAFTPVNIVKGFSATGISPFNSQIFSEEDFCSSKVTDRPNSSNQTAKEQTPPPTIAVQQDNVLNDIINVVKSPEEIRPFPLAPPRKTVSSRKPTKTKILTDTPNMNEIKLYHEKKNKERNSEGCKRNLNIQKKSRAGPSKQIKLKNIEEETDTDSVIMSSSSEDCTDIEECIENEKTEDNFIAGPISVGDYVLVRFATKKIVRHYAGKVLEVHDEGYLINFMRRKKPNYHFVYPDVPDQSIASESETIKLPPPAFVGGTARASRKLKFPINFDKFDNVD
ncbi:uncharacterized protein LOC116168884 [Photinus pyralis]|nr:uncharacterized protein LOC116160169 [Photinus pyralis]XP_031340740.1 uncharacterized protein LOC116168884 [Photinus pyralis]